MCEAILIAAADGAAAAQNSVAVAQANERVVKIVDERPHGAAFGKSTTSYRWSIAFITLSQSKRMCERARRTFSAAQCAPAQRSVCFGAENAANRPIVNWITQFRVQSANTHSVRIERSRATVAAAAPPPTRRSVIRAHLCCCVRRNDVESHKMNVDDEKAAAHIDSSSSVPYTLCAP